MYATTESWVASEEPPHFSGLEMVSVQSHFITDISLSVCLFMCVYMMLVALSMCLRVGAGIV